MRDNNQRVRALVLGVAAIGHEHPGNILLLTGVDKEMSWTAGLIFGTFEIR
ncbi:MAG TPA: hypothetical protein VGV35_06410 [Bryobacteraceae bacterium]|nr:hypothetical protein [Bryobacteraceae bacterium]